MGEARKRRLALIKSGHADVARSPQFNVPPSDLVSETFLATPELSEAITDRYENRVSAASKADALRTRADFLNALVVAGLGSFDRYDARQQQEAEAHPLIAQPTTAEVIKLS